MTEIDDLASSLARHLAVFQMEANHKIPALILAQQAGIIHRVAGQLQQKLEENPATQVRIDPRLNQGMETAYLDALGISTDVPDTPEGL